MAEYSEEEMQSVRRELEAANSSIELLESIMDLALKTSKSLLAATEAVGIEIGRVTKQRDDLEAERDEYRQAATAEAFLADQFRAQRNALEEQIKQSGKVDMILPDGTHLYWSTHCRHATDEEGHNKCQATEFAPGVERKPSQCKTCAAPCRCECHKDYAEMKREALNSEEFKAVMKESEQRIRNAGMGEQLYAVRANSVS